MGTSRDNRNEHTPTRSEQDSIATLVRCPTCGGGGVVSRDIAATVERLIKEAKERQ